MHQRLATTTRKLETLLTVQAREADGTQHQTKTPTVAVGHRSSRHVWGSVASLPHPACPTVWTGWVTMEKKARAASVVIRFLSGRTGRRDEQVEQDEPCAKMLSWIAKAGSRTAQNSIAARTSSLNSLVHPSLQRQNLLAGGAMDGGWAGGLVE